MAEDSVPELELPGFRFHPTEEELLNFYLRHVVFGQKLRFDIIGFLNIYHHDPWDLPDLARIGEREWYFFVPRDRKHGTGGRPNRTTENGFWKATGSDRRILSLSDPKKMLGLRKTLVFYRGRAPRGSKTDWVMNEYRLPDDSSPKDIVLCKIYRKATSLKVLEQRAAMQGETKALPMSHSPPLQDSTAPTGFATPVAFKQELEELMTEENVTEKAEDLTQGPLPSTSTSTSVVRLGSGLGKLPELQVPKFGMDWTQDPFWTQLRSPWLGSLTPYANILNF